MALFTSKTMKLESISTFLEENKFYIKKLIFFEFFKISHFVLEIISMMKEDKGGSTGGVSHNLQIIHWIILGFLPRKKKTKVVVVVVVYTHIGEASLILISFYHTNLSCYQLLQDEDFKDVFLPWHFIKESRKMWLVYNIVFSATLFSFIFLKRKFGLIPIQLDFFSTYNSNK